MDVADDEPAGGEALYIPAVVESPNRVTLFVPGTPASEGEWRAALKRVGLGIERGELRGDGLASPVELEWVENDGAFGEAFVFGTVDEDGVQAIDEAPLALVLHFPVDLRDGRQEITALVARLKDTGALAVRLEQSKLGWEVADWLERMTSDEPWSWHRAAIVIVGDEGALQSCGMSAFSLPDARIEVEGEDPDALRELISVLNVYQLGEDPLLLAGHTFAPDAETPRRVLERWPDTQYPPGHACHNPYGVWRVGAPGSRGRPPPELAAVFMPALSVTLLALEDKAKKSLSRVQVEAARDGHTCVAMPHREVQKLERSRGYADIDPELAWEQWQIVRQREE